MTELPTIKTLEWECSLCRSRRRAYDVGELNRLRDEHYEEMHPEVEVTRVATTVPTADVFTSPGPVEAVNHPAHYGGDTVYEAIKVIEAWELGFALGNTVKYISRAGRKHASPLEDLKKAAWYLQREIARLEARDD